MNVKPSAGAGEITMLRAADGHEFSAYVAQPEGKPRGGVIIVQGQV